MPSRKAGDGEYRDIAHPINSDTRDKIQRIILEKYEIAILESETEEEDREENGNKGKKTAGSVGCLFVWKYKCSTYL